MEKPKLLSERVQAILKDFEKGKSPVMVLDRCVQVEWMRWLVREIQKLEPPPPGRPIPGGPSAS